jgi:mono/diheme cytochrome c family protein
MSMTVGEPKAGEAIVTVVTDGPVEVVAELGVAPPPRHWNHWKTTFLIALPLLLALYVFLAARSVVSVAGYQPPEPVVLIRGEPDGPALYAQNCARCHGIGGNADGQTSPSLDPPARKFGQEKFMLGTTSTSIPSDDDLVYLMRHGIPGSAMPDFPNLTDDERRAIAQHIRRLAYAGLYAKRFALIAKDEDPDPKEVHDWVAKQLTVGDPLPLPTNLNHPGPNAIVHGKEIFVKNCATCHGPEGKGDGKDVNTLKKDNGLPTRPRDLARGIYKGGGEADRLFARISLGMPGTPMPDLRLLPPEDRADLVHFVRSLSGREPGGP